MRSPSYIRTRIDARWKEAVDILTRRKLGRVG